MDYLTLLATNPIAELTLALVLGIALGIERSHAKKSAGMRTYALVAMGACLFVIIGRLVDPAVSTSPGPLYVLQGLIVGMGFIGGGAIFHGHAHNHEYTSGLTTAAGLWITAAIGAAVGFGYGILGIFTAALTLFVFIVLWFLERLVTGKDKEGHLRL